MFHTRRYKPIFPEKYVGDPTSIYLRSSWETRFALWCDKNPAVVSWKSEEVVIPYRSPIDKRIHRYFVDFSVTIKDKETNTLKTYLVEIKPYSQTIQPEYPGSQTRRYLKECHSFIVNSAKWKAAKEYALDRNQKFIILTEKELGLENSK
jgi:hypothetical protein